MRALILALCVSLFVFAGCSKPPDNSNANSPDAGSAANSSSAASSSPSADSSSAPSAPAPVVVPSGTTLAISLGEEVGSKVSQAGQGFSGTLSRAVKVNGSDLIPAGSKVSGTVVDAKPLGHFKGGALLQLRLISVTVNGNQVPIQTGAITLTKKGKGKRSAVVIGGGAAAGALIGGLLGGGKGAAVGALAGGGAGTAGAAYTGNDEIVLPAESALSFKLTRSVQLQ